MTNEWRYKMDWNINPLTKIIDPEEQTILSLDPKCNKIYLVMPYPPNKTYVVAISEISSVFLETLLNFRQTATKQITTDFIHHITEMLATKIVEELQTE